MLLILHWARPRIPATLVVLAGGISVSEIFGLADRGVRVKWQPDDPGRHQRDDSITRMAKTLPTAPPFSSLVDPNREVASAPDIVRSG